MLRPSGSARRRQSRLLRGPEMIAGEEIFFIDQQHSAAAGVPRHPDGAQARLELAIAVEDHLCADDVVVAVDDAFTSELLSETLVVDHVVAVPKVHAPPAT